MNNLYQQFKLGQFSKYNANNLQKQQIDSLIENNSDFNTNNLIGINLQKKRFYKSSKQLATVNCLELNDNNDGKLLLAGNNNGSIALWSLNEKVKDDILINKKLNSSNYIKNKGDNGNNTNLGRRNDTVRDDTSSLELVHRSKKFKFYRGASNYSNNNNDSNVNNSSLKVNDDGTIYHLYKINTIKWYNIDNGIFFTGGQDNLVNIWDTENFKIANTINMNNCINQLDIPTLSTNSSNTGLSTDHNLICVASDDYSPHLIDMRNFNQGISVLNTINPQNKQNKKQYNKSPNLCGKWNPKSKNIVCFGDMEGNIKLWDIRMTQKLLNILKTDNTINNSNANGLQISSMISSNFSNACNDLIWTPNGNKIVTISVNGKIIMWDPWDNDKYENKFNDNENMNQLSLHKNDKFGLSKNHFNFKQIGDVDITRNKIIQRSSRRLLFMNDDYLLVNTDLSELQVYDVTQCKYFNKIDYPFELKTENRYEMKKNDNAKPKGKRMKTLQRPQFTDMVLQKDITNGISYRLICGLNNNDNSNTIIEYLS